VIWLEDSDLVAVGAPAAGSFDEIFPLLGRVFPRRASETRAPELPDNSSDLWVVLAIPVPPRARWLGMGCIPFVCCRPVLKTMSRSPATHRLARSFRISPHPSAPIRATLVRIFVRH